MDEFILRTTPMPDDMRVLLDDYPREAWAGHPNFAQSTQNWMGAHQMFRKLAALSRSETELYLDKSRSGEEYVKRLSYYGDLLVRNLHGHHHWEDHSFFPELSEADPRFDHGLEILEKDHEALDGVLDRLVEHANRTIKLEQLSPKDMKDEAGLVHKASLDIEALLARHLTDEEDLIVPIILHHKLRG